MTNDPDPDEDTRMYTEVLNYCLEQHPDAFEDWANSRDDIHVEVYQ